MRASVRLWLLGCVLLALGACGTSPRAPAPIEHGGRGAPPQAAACERTYTVRRGDTLSAIAVRCGSTVEAIAAENGLARPYPLREGQVLRMPGPSVYVVRRGDNLYRIALNHGMTTRELARLNSISETSVIYPGQELRVAGAPRQTADASERPAQPPASRGGAAPPSSAPSSAPAPSVTEPAPEFIWPLRGDVVGRFGNASGRRLDGIRIAARVGEPVRAAAAGEVVYAGNELQGYGELVLIRHEDRWVTAYGLNSVLRVQQGQRVNAGDHIADAGGAGPGDTPVLHFEIRRGVTPVDPIERLPRR
ncbi:MAG: M23 family metallopeptidase [Oceanicaulis sp.]|nr:M23 family metallopeptidase [Oceanicaulis sp.]